MTITQTLDTPLSDSARPPQALAGAALEALTERFPPRPYEDDWPETSQSLEEVMARLNRPPLRAASACTHDYRQCGAQYILRWLQRHPGDTWQQRWNASPAGSCTGSDWNKLAAGWTGYRAVNANGILNSGLLALVSAEVLRPSLHWQLTRSSTNMRAVICQHRDPEGFARLEQMVGPQAWSSHLGKLAKSVLVKLVIAKGGGFADITVGDALEFMEAFREHRSGTNGQSLFYSWLRELGHMPPDAPTTLRFLTRTSGQVSVERLVDRYNPQSKPIRDLLVDYLKECQPTMDYTSLEDASRTLVRNFWTQIERIQPGIDTLRLPPEVAAAWKQASRTKTTRRRLPDGSNWCGVGTSSAAGHALAVTETIISFVVGGTGPNIPDKQVNGDRTAPGVVAPRAVHQDDAGALTGRRAATPCRGRRAAARLPHAGGHRGEDHPHA